MNYWGRDWPSALALFTELKICVHNHAGYELLRPRSTINPADVVSKRHPSQLAPVSATDWQHTKSWDISLNCHIGKYRGVIRSKIVFLESVTFQFHACMLSSESEVAQSSHRSFRTLASGSLSVTAMLDFSGKANTSIHGLGEDDTATSTMCYT